MEGASSKLEEGNNHLIPNTEAARKETSGKDIEQSHF